MSHPDLPPLNAWIDLVRAADDDADHRLPLVEQTAPLLYAGADALAAEREALADRLERWRYQCLNKLGGRLSAEQQRLVDVLDLAANAILKRPPRPPKAPRKALARASFPDEQFEQALDPGTPLETVVAWAQMATREHFAFDRGATFRGCEMVGPACRAGPSGDVTKEPQTERRSRPLGGTSLANDSPPRRRMLLYAPLYLSSYCINHCLYCHFRFPHQLEREHLDRDAALAQAEFLGRRGFRRLLLVAGDYPRLTSIDYYVEIVQALAERGFRVAVEIAPQSTSHYAQLVRAGACGVTLYQETYQEEMYAQVHPRGVKHWFDWRLEGPERAAEAGMTRVGLGILLGLAPPAPDLRALAAHGRYLRRRYPHLTLAFSLPRLHEAPQGFVPAHRVNDETFVRFYCALRLAFPAAELVLSTRERPELRDRLARICITQMSAESCTSPGGYGAEQPDARDRGQFPVSDHRTAAEIAAMLRRAGCEACWSVD